MTVSLTNAFIVLDASEVVRDTVLKKVLASTIPKQMKEAVAMRAANLASSRVTRSKIAQKISRKLCQTMPMKLKEMGLTVVLEETFREKHYFVLELQVQHVDAMAAEKAQREKGFESSREESSSIEGTLLDWSLKLMGEDNQRMLEEEYLPAKVQHKLEKQMLHVIREKFENMHMKAEVTILKEGKQGRYFFSTLKAVQQEVEARSLKNQIQEMRRRVLFSYTSRTLEVALHSRSITIQPLTQVPIAKLDTSACGWPEVRLIGVVD